MVFLKKLVLFALLLAFLLSTVNSCKPQVSVRLATTTSLEQSGLLGELLDAITKKTHIAVHVITTGSGTALELGKKGDVDLVIAHAPELEQTYMESGLVEAQHSFLSSRFVLLGPFDDPAQVAQATTPEAALEKIAVYNTRHAQTASNKPVHTLVFFISRGDNSGTDIFEKSLWNKIGIKPDPAWYKEPGQGMSEALLLANSLGAYIIADLPTWLSVSNSAWFKQNYTTTIKILYESSQQTENFSNIYSILIFKNSSDQKQKYARMVVDFLLSQESQTIIGNFSIQGINCYQVITQSMGNQ